ncbi:MAG: four helix bundle protein [Methanobacteriota archaeon]
MDALVDGFPSGLKDLEVWREALDLACNVRSVTRGWRERDAVRHQLDSSISSIGANLAEGVGRGLPGDRKRGAAIARGSAYESLHWMALAHREGRLPDTKAREWALRTTGLCRRLHRFIRYCESRR